MSVATPTSTPTPPVVRGALDRLVSLFGVVLVVVFLVAGGVAAYASSFIGSQVKDQLAMQDITMPTAEAIAELSPEDQAALEPFLGEQMTTGAQAKAFADHYILAHMNAASGGRTYEEVSGEFLQLSPEEQQSEDGQALAGLRQTLFMGNTLRGLLLNAYAFGTMGVIAGYVSIAAFVAAVVMAVLSFLGLRHANQVMAKA